MKKAVLMSLVFITLASFVLDSVSAYTIQTWSNDCRSGFLGGTSPWEVRYSSYSDRNGYDICGGSKKCVSGWSEYNPSQSYCNYAGGQYCCAAGGGTGTCGSGKIFQTWQADCLNECWGYAGKVSWNSPNSDGYDTCGGINNCLSGWSNDYKITVSCGSKGSGWNDFAFCCKCTVTSWTPDTSTYCSGVSFAQTNNCGGERTATGTADCNCQGSAPTGTGVIKGPSTFSSPSYSPKTWTYDASASTSTPCKWKCATGYTQSENGCVASAPAQQPTGLTCGQTITQSTNLTQDLQCSGTALIIGADNIVLDCQNYKITGNRSGYGINATGRKNVTIKNCQITNFSTGISLFDVSFSRVLFNNLTYNQVNGIGISKGENITIDSNTLRNNTYGIIIGQYSKGNVIVNNTAENNKYYEFYVVVHSHNNIFRGNTLKGGIAGIWFSDNSSYNKIYDNIITNNTNGIVFQATALINENNTVYNNLFNNTNNVVSYGANYFNITKTPGKNIIGGSYIGGNYWSDYAGQDTNGDGIGDTNIPHNSSNKISIGGDYLPLTRVTGPIPPASCDLINCSLLNLTTTPKCTNTTPAGCCIWNATQNKCFKNCSDVNCALYNTSESCKNAGERDCCQWKGYGNSEYCEPIPGGGGRQCNYNGIIDYNLHEECDPGCNPAWGYPSCPLGFIPANLSGQTCRSLGYEAGTLSCTRLCRFNFDLCSGICESTSSYSKWTDTNQPSEQNCRRVINNQVKTCCPSGKTCREVNVNGVDKWICLQEGISECRDYRHKDECEGFDENVAKNSISKINSSINCGGLLNGNYVYCKCEWKNNKCQPAYDLLKNLDDKKNIIGTCSYSYTESECDSLGFKTILYRASGTAEGCSGTSEVRSPCFVTTEVPFFSFFGLISAVGLIIGYYLMKRK